MAQIIEQIGITATAFLRSLSEIWDWLTETTLWTWEGVNYTPIMLFGAGFAVIIGVILVKEIIF